VRTVQPYPITVLNILLLTGRKNDDLKIESSVENKRNRRLKIPRFLELNRVYKLIAKRQSQQTNTILNVPDIFSKKAANPWDNILVKKQNLSKILKYFSTLLDNNLIWTINYNTNTNLSFD
jgi:hypothetical protein